MTRLDFFNAAVNVDDDDDVNDDDDNANVNDDDDVGDIICSSRSDFISRRFNIS